MSDEVKNYGLYLNLAKCEVWWPEEPSGDMQAAYPDALSQKYTEGTLIVNAPLVSDVFMKRMLFEKVRSVLKTPFRNSCRLENSQVAFNQLNSV